MFSQYGHACMHALSLQSCLTLCHPMDCSPPGASVHGILQARTLEWVTMPASRGSSPPRDRTLVSYVYLRWQAFSLPLAPPGEPHYRHTLFYCTLASQVALMLKNPPANSGDVRNLGSIPG